MFDGLSILVPSFRSRELTLTAIRSFLRFRPPGLSLEFIVVENSDDASYRDEVTALGNVTWIQNPTQERESRANAEAIIIARGHATHDWVFVAHNDVCVTSVMFYIEMWERVRDGNVLVGTVLDPSRVHAIHVSGYLIRNDLLQDVHMWPVVEGGVMTHDVGDMATVMCRELGYPHFCFDNTFNGASMGDGMLGTFSVDRCLSDHGEVIFMHLGRGAPKTLGTYGKPGKVMLPEWLAMCDSIMTEFV